MMHLLFEQTFMKMTFDSIKEIFLLNSSKIIIAAVFAVLQFKKIQHIDSPLWKLTQAFRFFSAP